MGGAGSFLTRGSFDRYIVPKLGRMVPAPGLQSHQRVEGDTSLTRVLGGGRRSSTRKSAPGRLTTNQRTRRAGLSERTAAVPGVDIDAQDERVALRRAGVPRQRVLQRGQELVAVQRYHPVVVVRCCAHRRSHASATASWLTHAQRSVVCAKRGHRASPAQQACAERHAVTCAHVIG